MKNDQLYTILAPYPRTHQILALSSFYLKFYILAGCHITSHRITNAYRGLANTLQTQELKQKWWGKITENSSGSSKRNVLAFFVGTNTDTTT